MIKSPKESKRYVEAVLKAFSILESFEVESPLSLQRISELTDLNKSGIMRICGTLMSLGYIGQDPKTGSYQLGNKVLRLSAVYSRRNPIISLARPILRELVELTSESAALSKRVGTHRVGLVWEEGTHLIRYSMNSEGKTMRLFAGAAGKVLLTYAPEEVVNQVINSPEFSKPLTGATITDPDLFRKELTRTRKQGYGFSFGERKSEVAALAVPVYDSTGSVCAALSLIGTIQRFSNDQYLKHFPILLEKADKLSRLLGAP